MAAPVYNVDLTDIDLCEATTNFSALGGGGAGLGAGVDFAIQGTNCVDKQVTDSGGSPPTQKGMVSDFGSGISMGAEDHVFMWLFAATPGILEPLTGFTAGQLHGKTVTIGTATNALNNYAVDGSDTQPEGGNKAYAVKYTTAVPSPGEQVGSPGANPQWFGGQLSINSTAKGVNFGIDAIRYGTGGFVTEGTSGDTATFTDFAVQNDDISNKWGILQAVGGGFEAQGKFYIGRTSGGTSTQAYFVDSNALITLTDTPHSTSGFTQFIIDGTGNTTCLWTNITILALGTGNTGQIHVLNSGDTVTFTTCTFSSIGVTKLAAGVTANGCTWRDTDQITQSGGTIDDCTIAGNTNSSALLCDDPSKIINCEFTFSNGHALEFTETGTSNWVGNTFVGAYSGATGTNDTPNSGSVNAMIFNDSGGDVTLNVSDGDTPSVRNGAGATTTINNTVAVTVTGLTDLTEVRVYDSATSNPQVELAGVEDATDGSTDNRSFTFSLQAGTQVDIVYHNKLYDSIPPRTNGFVIPTTATTFEIVQLLDPNYNGSGT
jgi:hypothetical protein